MGTGPAPDPPAGNALSIVLTSATWIVLRAAAPSSYDRPGGLAGFSLNTSIMLSGVPCLVGAVSSDASWAVVRTPFTAALPCASSTGAPLRVDCGYQTLSVSNPRPSSTIFGASLSCPPFCPGSYPGSVPVPFDGGFIPAWPQPPGTPPAPVALATLAAARVGIYYSLACSASSAYTDPTTGACANASDPASYSCALGSGDSCQPCPSGGLCPGGSRMWPRAGFYFPFETAPPSLLQASRACAVCSRSYAYCMPSLVLSMQACSPPDPAARCSQWNSSSGSTQCGRGAPKSVKEDICSLAQVICLFCAGYLQGSFLCSACDKGFYAPGDGSCAECPIVASLWDR